MVFLVLVAASNAACDCYDRGAIIAQGSVDVNS